MSENHPNPFTSHKISRRAFMRGVAIAALKPDIKYFLEPNFIWPENDKTPPALREYITNLVTNPPNVGAGNTDPFIKSGIGFATFEFSETHPAFSTTIKNRLKGKEINPALISSPEDARQKLVENQSMLSPDEALNSGNYIGYMAAVKGIGGKYLIYAQPNPETTPIFKGIALQIDNSGHVKNLYKKYWFPGSKDPNIAQAHNTWKNAGLNHGPLQWILDGSAGLMRHLPTGVDSNNENLMQGRPGVIIISEAEYKAIMST